MKNKNSLEPQIVLPQPVLMERILPLAMEEILGQRGVEAVYQSCNSNLDDDNQSPRAGNQKPVFHIGALQSTLETLYGPRAGRGLALRIGCACFKYLLHELGPEYGLNALAFRLLPLSSRLVKGSEALAELFNELTAHPVRMEQNDRYIYWNIDRGSLSAGEKEGSVCMLAVGLIQEALYWVSAGRIFQVEEKSGLVCDEHMCTIVIDRIPVS